MDDWFDGLAKDSARRLSRRQVFGRVAFGAGAAMLAIFSRRLFARADCGKVCEECCKNNFPPPKGSGIPPGVEYGECVSQCHRGEGICGPIVCPQS